MIEVNNLVKKYGDHIAVDNLTFSIDKGRIYGFLDPNGAGKTTTMAGYVLTAFLATLSAIMLVLLVLVPILTMRSFAEERKSRTDQLLFTSPVKIRQIMT